LIGSILEMSLHQHNPDVMFHTVFYDTPTMIKQDIVSISHLNTFTQERENYQKNLDVFEKQLKNGLYFDNGIVMKNGLVYDGLYTGKIPVKPYSVAASSMKSQVFYNEPGIKQVEWFSNATLYNIIRADLWIEMDERYANKEITEKYECAHLLSRKDRIDYVLEIISAAPMKKGATQMPFFMQVYRLMQGVLVSYNVELLSDDDLMRVANAHGAVSRKFYSCHVDVKKILASQVSILQELFDRDAVENYHSYFDILRNNLYALGSFIRLSAEQKHWYYTSCNKKDVELEFLKISCDSF
jgi:hypothetical protein